MARPGWIPQRHFFRDAAHLVFSNLVLRIKTGKYPKTLALLKFALKIEAKELDARQLRMVKMS